MTDTQSSLLDTPTEPASTAAPVDLAAELNRQISLQVNTWAHQDELRAPCISMLIELRQRLADAGFVEGLVAQRKAEVLPSLGFFVTWMRRSWSHPDSQVPMLLDVTLTVHTAAQRRGLVTLELELVDENDSSNRLGVLAGNLFWKSIVLIPEGAQTTFAEWKQHVLRGVQAANKEVIAELADALMVHLEKATSA